LHSHYEISPTDLCATTLCKIINVRIPHEHGAPVSTGSYCVKYNPPKGKRIAQAYSGSDSDSESWNKNEEIIPVNRLTQNVWIAPPTKDILCTNWRQLSESESEPESACTIGFAPTGADSRNRCRNLNLPALYAYPKAGPAYFCVYNFVHQEGILLAHAYYVYIQFYRSRLGCYTECPRRNVPDFGRVFLMLKYTDITQNTYVRS